MLGQQAQEALAYPASLLVLLVFLLPAFLVLVFLELVPLVSVVLGLPALLLVLASAFHPSNLASSERTSCLSGLGSQGQQAQEALAYPASLLVFLLLVFLLLVFLVLVPLVSVVLGLPALLGLPVLVSEFRPAHQRQPHQHLLRCLPG